PQKGTNVLCLFVATFFVWSPIDLHLLEDFRPGERHDDISPTAGKDDFPMRRIDGQARELHSRQLLSRDSPAWSHVFLIIQIPGAYRSARTTPDQQAFRRKDFDLAAAPRDLS